ncbi:MAG: imidazolonepropionase [Myxococcales bacterium]
MPGRLPADLVVHNAAELCTMVGAPGGGAAAAGVVRNGALAAREGSIVWVGPSAELADRVETLAEAEIVDASGHVVTPGLVDPHTHLVFAGDRSGELAQRLGGMSYLDIARAGGGIQSTVQATRATPRAELIEQAAARATRLLEQGVTTCEVKSGYGLSVAAELELLEVIRGLAERTPLEIVPTLLALHALPPEARASRGAYVEEIASVLVPRAAERRLCRMVDAVLEAGAFSAAEVGRLFESARRRGLALRLHADQLSPGGGAELAASFGALSADHLERISPAGIDALAKGGTAAVLAPVATWFLRLPGYAPARALLDAGVAVALCTNWNPGSAPTESVALTLGAACLAYGLQPAEALHAFTAGAARALDLGDRLGRLAPGFQADLAVFGCADHRHLVSHLAVDHARAVVKRGKLVARPLGQLCS